MADKQLDATAAASAFQKAVVRRSAPPRVRRAPAVRAACRPTCRSSCSISLDVPAVSNQWWAAIVAAKRQAPAYLDAMDADGLHDGLCRYCSLGYASTRYGDVQAPPWGGLPTPRLLCARLTCDCIHRVFALWAEAFGAELVRDRSSGRRRSAAAVVGARPASMARARRTAPACVRRRRRWSGSSSGSRRSAAGALDRDALRERLELVNQQEEMFDAVRRLIATRAASARCG